MSPRAADTCATLPFAVGVVWAAGACGNNSAHKLTDEFWDGESLSGLIVFQEGTHSGMGEVRELLTGRAIATSVITAGMQRGPATLLKTACGDENLSHTTQRKKDSRRTCSNT